MKKIKVFLLVSVCVFFQPTSNLVSASIISSPAEKFNIPPKSIEQFKLSEFVKFSAKDFQKIVGKKISFRERISFNITKSRMKNYLKHHTDITLGEYVKIEEKAQGKTNWFWLSLGMLGPILGKLIIYLISDANSAFIWIPMILAPVAVAFTTKQSKRNKKSVLIGAGILTVVGLLAALINNIYMP